MSGHDVNLLLLGRKQVEQKRRQSALLQHSRNVLIAWTTPAAAAAMCKCDNRHRFFRDNEIVLARQAEFGHFSQLTRQSLSLCSLRSLPTGDSTRQQPCADR